MDFPLFVEEQEKRVIKMRKVVAVSWTDDHRIIEGAYVARFSNFVRFLIENPQKIVLYA